MDTKSKKFDRSMITKTICFLLAMLFAAFGTAQVLRAACEVDENEANYTYYDNVFRQGKNFDLPTSRMFEIEYQYFIQTAIENALIYSDGSKKAYEEYVKKYNDRNLSFVKEAKADLKKEILKESGTISIYKTFSEFTKGAISLEKIGDHKTHTFSTGTYVYNSRDNDAYFYNGNTGYTFEISRDGGVVGAYTYDEYYENFYGEYDEEDIIDEPTTMEDITKPVMATTTVYGNQSSSEAFYDENDGSLLFTFTASSGIPESIKSKAKDADGVIEICSAAVDDSRGFDGTYDRFDIDNTVQFDGYYSFNINEKYLMDNLSEYLDNYHDRYDEWNLLYTNLNSYSDFKVQADKNAEELARYKNLSFAIAENKTGKILATTLPGTNKNMSVKEIEDAFLSNGWSISRNYEDPDTMEEHGELFESIARNYSNYPYDGSMHFSESYLAQSEEPYTLFVSLDTSLKAEDMLSTMSTTYKQVYTFVKSNVMTFAFYVLGFLICVIILIVKSGRKHGDDEMHMMRADKIFTILRTAINAALITGLVFLFFVLLDGGGFLDYYHNYSDITNLIIAGCSIITAVIAALLIDWLMYLARHIKNHTLIKNIFIIWLLREVWSVCKKHNAKIKAKIKAKKEKYMARPAVYRDIFNDIMRKVTLGILAPNMVFGIIIVWCFGVDAYLLGMLFLILFFAYDIFAISYIVVYAYSLRKIFYALNQIRSGNYDVQIDKTKMPQSVKAYANDVEALKEGLKIAIENAVREQRTKTELITNVSHDLKTPLTSVITYVDLLSRCEITDETAREYIEVLGEKSARLKRLIEDLVEASKAQTGNINVKLIKVSLKELVSQITGEYEDELSARNLSVVLTMPEEDVTVMADSKMCYRVLDNLLGNVKKYAMENTRVYVDVTKEGGKGVITIRNISATQLNIAPEELMARFVRGDSSRSTEGSGLGLSIAENFCRLQNGKLTLEITGDLFTAKVCYELA